jgi:hypothetical protein
MIRPLKEPGELTMILIIAVLAVGGMTGAAYLFLNPGDLAPPPIEQQIQQEKL